jgi:hypothetical protein
VWTLWLPQAEWRTVPVRRDHQARCGRMEPEPEGDLGFRVSPAVSHAGCGRSPCRGARGQVGRERLTRARDPSCGA